MIVLIGERCDLCGTCVAVCPADALELGEQGLRIDPGLCLECLGCVQVCPWRALEERG